jgi:hypothetical protein
LIAWLDRPHRAGPSMCWQSFQRRDSGAADAVFLPQKKINPSAQSFCA